MDFVLGPGFTMLYDVVKEAMGGEILHFKPLEDLESTLDSLDPQTMKRMAEVNTNLGLSVAQIENLKTQMETGTQLVRKLSKLQTCNCIARCQYAGELDTLNRSLKALKKKLKDEGQLILRESFLILKQNMRTQPEPSAVKEIFNLVRQIDEMLAGLAREVPEEEAHTVLMVRQKMEQLLAFERQWGTLDLQPEAIEVTENSVAISNTGVVVDVQQESTEEIEVTETSVAIINTGVVVDVQQESTEAIEVTETSVAISNTVVVVNPRQKSTVFDVVQVRNPFSDAAQNVVAQNQNQFGVRCAVPPLPLVTDGLKEPLEDLKMKLLKDGPASIFVLTAPRGCGKTTLATMFCHDQEVKDKFKENIFFATVSNKLSFLIVQELWEHTGMQAPALPNEEIAFKWLQKFVTKRGQNPLLIGLG